MDVEKIKQIDEFSQKILSMTDEKIKEFMVDFFTDAIGGKDQDKIDIIEKSSVCRKVVNSRVKEVSFEYYDSIMIDSSGIWIIPEHGSNYCVMSMQKVMKFQNLNEKEKWDRALYLHLYNDDKTPIEEHIYMTLQVMDQALDGDVARYFNDSGYANLTCCPQCRVDDFTHVEGCGLIMREDFHV